MKRTMDGPSYAALAKETFGMYQQTGGKKPFATFVTKIIGYTGFSTLQTKMRKGQSANVRQANVDVLVAAKESYKKAMLNSAASEMGRKADATLMQITKSVKKEVIPVAALLPETTATTLMDEKKEIFAGQIKDFLVSDSNHLDNFRAHAVAKMQGVYAAKGDLQSHIEDLSNFNRMIKPMERKIFGI